MLNIQTQPPNLDFMTGDNDQQVFIENVASVGTQWHNV